MGRTVHREFAAADALGQSIGEDGGCLLAIGGDHLEKAALRVDQHDVERLGIAEALHRLVHGDIAHGGVTLVVGLGRAGSRRR